MSHPTRDAMAQRRIAEAERLDGAWREKAACARYSVAMFFPEPTPGAGKPDFEPALAVCRGCEVLEDCLRWATTAGEVKDGYTTHGQVVAGCAPKGRYYGVKPHGTLAAYRRHERSGEVPCRSCAAAKAEYNRERWAKRAAS